MESHDSSLTKRKTDTLFCLTTPSFQGSWVKINFNLKYSLFPFIYRDRNAIKFRNAEKRLERQRTLEEGGGTNEQQNGEVVVGNGSVPHHAETPAVRVGEHTDIDRRVVHATVHKEEEGLPTIGTIVANGKCLNVPKVPIPDYGDAAMVTSNGVIRKDSLEFNHVPNVANGHVIKGDYTVVGNGIVADDSTKPDNLTDEKKAEMYSSTVQGDKHNGNEDDINPRNMEQESLQGSFMFSHGVENVGFEPEAEMKHKRTQPVDGDTISATRWCLDDTLQNEDYIKELVYP